MAADGWTSSTDAPDVRAVQPDAEGLVHGVDMHENMRNFFALRTSTLLRNGRTLAAMLRQIERSPSVASPT